MKYITEVKNNKLTFKITTGEFEGVSYIYETLTSNGLKYKIINDNKKVNDNNKYIFENEIRKILDSKLKKIK